MGAVPTELVFFFINISRESSTFSNNFLASLLRKKNVFQKQES